MQMRDRTAEIEAMLREAREAPVEFEEAGDLSPPIPDEQSTDREAMLRAAFEVQREIEELNKRLRAKKKQVAEMYEKIAALGMDNDPKSEFRFMAGTRAGNRFIVPSRFMARFPEIFTEHIDDLISIPISSAREFINEKNLEPVMDRQPDRTVYSVDYVPVRLR